MHTSIRFILIIAFLFITGVIFKNQVMVYAQQMNGSSEAQIETSAPATTPITEPVQSTERYYEATVLSVSEAPQGGQLQQGNQEILLGQQGAQGRTATVTVTTGDLKGKELTVDIIPGTRTTGADYKEGDKVIILQTQGGNQTVTYIVDYVRTPVILVLAILFCFTVIFISGKNGLFSIAAMIYSFFIIGRFIVPNIIAGSEPVFIALMGGLMISPVTFYSSHGINWKTTVAIIGTAISLLLTGILAVVFVRMAQLTGAISDEAAFVQTLINQDINLQSLLLAGIIIGSFGILDDITVSQASIVQKLLKTAKDTSFQSVFKNAMDVGKDHIASLVNTLVLVYAGASLPLFMLFYSSNLSYTTALSNEIVATEVIRTLVGSIGLVAAVPITTMLACVMLKNKE